MLPLKPTFQIHLVALITSLLVLIGHAWCDGPDDNRPETVRPIPPLGMNLDQSTRDALQWRCKAIRAQWQVLLERSAPLSPERESEAVRPASEKVGHSLTSLASEVLVFPRAVELALEFDQFYSDKDLMHASELLDVAAARLAVIERGGTWSEVVGITQRDQPATIIGGYESKIDGSIQPYGLVIPAGMSAGDVRPRRLDLWFHGRGETMSEVAFLGQQRSSTGQYTPDDTFVLHPYGRYCNAFKFAGEVDVLEVLEYIQGRLPVDDQQIAVRGFSMGGAACWQFAVHYADRWFAANPGAGFSETPEFLAFFQSEDVRSTAPWYQQKLWQLYDCPVWARNLVHCPTIAYSGQLDRQKQAADRMAEAMSSIGIDLVHLIGPETEHKIHEGTKVEIESRMHHLARRSSDQVPQAIQFTTVTLRYHRMHWVDVQGLEQHWKPATVRANVDGEFILATTENVNRIRFLFDAGQWPGNRSGAVFVEIDGQVFEGPLVRSDQSWSWELERLNDRWKVAETESPLRKRPGLQGPIDDAFLDSFLFVLPSGTSNDPLIQSWVESESLHAMTHWRKHFRGDVRQKLDHEVNETDIQTSHLILFGDANSNQLIQRISSGLPVAWDAEAIRLGGHSVPGTGHVPVLIYPNPLNQNRYVVLNSGFTFREYDYLNNARQTPKLPDWALLDVSSGATSQHPGQVVVAGFFDEHWQP